jgi:S-adenosylmethionine uptake transporter
MTEHARSNLRGALYSLLSFALFATHDVIVKSLGSHYSTFQIIFFSVLLSFPLVILMLMRDAEKATLLPVHPWWTALRTVAAMVTGVAAFYAFATIPLAQVYAIIFASPLLITVLSIPVLGERVGPHRWGAVVIGLIGVFVVIRPGAAPLELGHAAAVTAACTSSVASIIVRKIGNDERRAVLLLYPMMGNFLVMGAAMPLVYIPLPIEHLGALALMSALAFGASLLIILAYTSGDAAIVAPMQYSQILWAALYGWLFFGESADKTTWFGAAIIIASGLYIVLRETFAGTSITRPVVRTRARPDTGTSPRRPTIQDLPGTRD